MNFKDINVTLRAAAALCALNRHHEMADRLGAIADLFREFLEGATKLAEREKALTEALEFYADGARYRGPNQPNSGGDKFTAADAAYTQDVTRDGGFIARAALALHKEDA